MLPVWYDTDRIPVWVWLLAIAAFVGVALVASSPGFDAEAAIRRAMQGITGAVLAGGLFWMWHGGRTLWRLRVLRHYGVQAEGRVTALYRTAQRAKRSSSLKVETTWLIQHLLSYRLELPEGAVDCGPMRVDSELAESLAKDGPVQVRYLPGRPKVSAPEQIAVLQVKVMRGMQFGAGLVLVVWALGWLAPGAFFAGG